MFQTLHQLNALRKQPHSPWLRTPTPGHLRGIDFYAPVTFVWVMASAMRQYYRKHKVYPNIVTPNGFNEKIFWFKFFGEVKVPEAGNKLATPSFIPDKFKSSLTCLPKIWESSSPKLPDNHLIAPGIYYLKANLGSDMFERVEFPLSPNRRQDLKRKAQGWLTSKYGIERGEWWYNTFEPKLFLEQSVTGDQDSISWNFYVLNGQIPMVGMYIKHHDGRTSSTWLDAEFELLPQQSILPAVQNFKITERHKEMRSIAYEIGKSFSALRVDFLQGSNEQIYLCELTFSPGDGLSRRPPEVDALLSAPWKELQ